MGLVPIAIFILRALRVERPLLDVRLFANKAFAAASLTTFALGAALFGAMILMPLYFQTVRGEDAVHTGLLLIPQGVGAAFAMALSGRATERWGGGLTALLGGVITIVGTIPFVLIGGETSFVLLGRGDDLPRLRHRHVDDAVDDRRLRRPAARPGQPRDAAAERRAARRRLDRHGDTVGRALQQGAGRRRGRDARTRSPTPSARPT